MLNRPIEIMGLGDQMITYLWKWEELSAGKNTGFANGAALAELCPAA
jgi:hypothetical protein